MMFDQKVKSADSSGKRWLKFAQGGWLILAFLSGVLFVASMPGYFQRFMNPDEGDGLEALLSIVFDMQFINSALSFLTAGLSLGLAVLLFWRKRDDTMALFLAYFFLLYGVIMAGPLEVFALNQGNDQLALLAQPILMTLVLALLYTFPKGNFVPRWSGWLLLFASLLTPALILVTVNIGRSTPGLDVYLTSLALIFLLAVGFYGQIIRYRRISSPQERLQTKWVVYGLGLWTLTIIISTGPWFYSNTLPSDQPAPNWMVPFSALWWLGLMIVPITFTVAVLRYRLWDIDLIIRRTLIYGLLTALLVTLYFAGVVLLQALFTTLTGQQSPAAIVVSTLAIAALFQPLRRQVQSFIDRRFFRSKYDARYTLAQFAQTVRDEVDLDQISLALLEVVDKTLQPEDSSLWLRGLSEDSDTPQPTGRFAWEGSRSKSEIKLRQGDSDGIRATY